MWKDVRWATAITLIAALLVMAYGFAQTPKYEASAKILLGQKPPPSDCCHGVCLIPVAPKDATPLTATSLTVANAVPTKLIARAVIKQLSLPRRLSASKVVEHTSAKPEPGSMFVNISYTDNDPKRAQLITNTLAKVFSERFPEVAPVSRRLTATLWQPAKLPANPVSPNPIRNGLITLAIGLALSLVAIVLREYLRENYR